MRGHRVAFREVMPLRPPDFPPGGLQPLRAPFQRNRQGGIEPVELLQEIGLGRAGRGEQRVENQRLSIEPQVLALRLQFRDGQPPVHPAAGCPGPTDTGPVDELVQNLRRLPRCQATAMASGHRPSPGRPRPTAGSSPPPPGCSSRGIRIRFCCAALPASSSHRRSTTALRFVRRPPSEAPDRGTRRGRC